MPSKKNKVRAFGNAKRHIELYEKAITDVLGVIQDKADRRRVRRLLRREQDRIDEFINSIPTGSLL